MSKTYYLGFTRAGHPIGRASLNDYGYTHAAVSLTDEGVPARLPSFSSSLEGAKRNLFSGFGMINHPYEVVKVAIVDGRTYRKAMKVKANG